MLHFSKICAIIHYMVEILGAQESAERGTEAFRRGVEILRSAEEFFFRSRAQSTSDQRALAEVFADDLLQEKAYEATLAEALQVMEDSGLAKQ